jgi:hypothetical protein
MPLSSDKSLYKTDIEQSINEEITEYFIKTESILA